MSSEMHGMFPTAMEFLGYQSKNSLADNATDTDIATANLGSWRGFSAAAAEEQRSNSACWPPSGIAVSGLSSIPSSHNFQSLAAASRKEFHGGRSAENRKLGVSMDMAEIIQQGSNKQQHEQAYLVNTSGSSNNSRYHHQQQQHGYSFFDASSSTSAANALAAAHHSVLGLNLPSLEHHQHHHQQQLLPFSIPVSSSTRWQQQQQQQSNQADLGVVSNLSSVYSQQYSNGVAAVNNWMSSSTRGPLDASASAGGGGTSSQRLALSLSSSSSYSYRPPHPPEVQMISPGGGGGGGNLFQMGGESSRSVTASGRNSDGPVFMGLDALTAAVSHQPSRESAAAIIRGEGAARSLFSGYGNCLRNSIYFKPAQELLLEFCNVGCSGEAKLDKDTASNKKKATALDYSAAAAASGKTDEEFKSKKSGFNDDTPGPFAGDTYELQKRKAKLLSMLDEVDMRYKNYCSQLQMVVAAMEAVTAPGCAKPYTRLAVKAMSRHFRCLRDAITGQLQATARLLGENQVTLPGNTTRGETPRLGLIERAIRQHQHHHNNQNSPRLLDPHPWRPQRGLPERSVFILRSWLFEHFLHPYPTDGDKHILAKQTGLTRSQVSNWFINARVRLWKPMVEEMYMEELKEEKMEKEEVKDDAAGAGAGAAETDADKNLATTMNQATATGAADTVSYLQQQRFPSGNGSSSSFKVVAPAATETADSETTTSSSRREMATTPTTTQTQTQIQITMDEGPHPYKRLLQQQQLAPATAQTPGLQSACNVQDFVAYPAENLNLRYGSNNSTKKSSGGADTLGSNQNINNGVSLTLGLRHSGLPYHLSEPTAKYSATAAAGSGIYMAPRPTTATAAANSTQHHDAHFLEDSTANNNGSSGGGLIHQDLQQQYRHYTNGPRLLHDFVQG